MPPPYVANSSLESSDPNTPPLSYSILRNISSLISHLSLLNPREQESFTVESLAQTNDVILVSLLGMLGKNVQGMRELGKKLAIVESAKQSNNAPRKSQHLGLPGRFDEELFTTRDSTVSGKFSS
jgi:COP9 signalosome complex subunit 6